jgi:predicted DNA-binding protein with PD1-like motif
MRSSEIARTEHGRQFVLVFEVGDEVVQVELLAISGNIAEQDGEGAVHAHVVLGTRDGTTRGGHLIEGYVRPMLELIVDEVPAHLHRHYDPDTGLALIALEDSSRIS